MKHPKHSPGLILAVLFALIGLAACGSSTATPAATPTSTAAPVAGDFVGVFNTVDGIAISTNGQQLIAYVCDGPPSHAVTVSVWFKGAVSHNAADLTAANGFHLVVSWTAQAARGTVSLSNGPSFPFTATAVSAAMGPGLYRDEETFGGVRYLAGLILPPLQKTATATPASSALMSLAQLSGWLNPLSPAMIGPEPEWRGGVINEQTGALSPLPALTMQNFLATRRITVPNVGTFTMKPCQQGQC